MMLIFFLGAAQAVPLYKMNNEIVNDNNSILDSDLHNLAFADSDTAVVAAPQKQPSPPHMTPCPAYIDNLPETPELIWYKMLDKEQQETLFRWARMGGCVAAPPVLQAHVPDAPNSSGGRRQSED